MENILQGIPRGSVYLDDILVSGKSEVEHLNNLEQVLSPLQGIRARLKTEVLFHIERDSGNSHGLKVLFPCFIPLQLPAEKIFFCTTKRI